MSHTTPAKCRDCGVALVPRPKKTTYQRNMHGGRGLCIVDYTHHRYNGTLHRFSAMSHDSARLLENYEEMARYGVSRKTAAERLGVPYPTFERAILRAMAKRRTAAKEGQPA